MSGFLAFLVAHQTMLILIASAFAPTIFTMVTEHPTTFTPAILALLKLVCARFSIAEHYDTQSENPLKFPLLAAVPSGHPMAIELGSGRTTLTPPNGFALIPVLVGIFLATLLLSFSTHADPVKVEPVLPKVASSDTPPVTTTSFGGTVGVFSFQPAAVVIVTSINLHTKKVEGAFQPGLCYNATAWKGQWYSVGLNACGRVDFVAQQVSIGVVASVLNGYASFGWWKGFIGDVAARLVFGPSLSF